MTPVKWCEFFVPDSNGFFPRSAFGSPQYDAPGAEDREGAFIAVGSIRWVNGTKAGCEVANGVITGQGGEGEGGSGFVFPFTGAQRVKDTTVDPVDNPSIDSGSAEDIQPADVGYDEGTYTTVVSPWWFEVPVTGKYLLTLNLLIYNKFGPTTGSVNAQLEVNTGTDFKVACGQEITPTNNGTFPLSIAAELFLQANDRLKWVCHNRQDVRARIYSFHGEIRATHVN